MPVDLTQVSHEDILRLSPEARARLAVELIDSLEVSIKGEEYPLTESMIQLLEERLAEYDANPDEGRPWEEVLDEISANRCRNR